MSNDRLDYRRSLGLPESLLSQPPPNEVDELHRELRRAQGIIDGLKRYRETALCCPFDSTPEMRARIRELAYPPRDDFDRAVLALLRDFERLGVCISAKL